jgi:hypothetical protein
MCAVSSVREGLRDQLAAFRGRPPHMIAAAGPPRSRSVMNTPDAERGMRAILFCVADNDDLTAPALVLKAANKSARRGRIRLRM